MKLHQTAHILSTYSADSFGVCSALFELGGMIVMHDPSGCNSTYTTHDEPRWYNTDSLIFISGLNEQDAVLGRDDRFIRDVTVDLECTLDRAGRTVWHGIAVVPGMVEHIVDSLGVSGINQFFRFI